MKTRLCMLMLQEILDVLLHSRLISETIVITGDKVAEKAAKKTGAHVIFEHVEKGVNRAVSLANKYVQDKFDATLVLPQDIPFITDGDIEFLFKIQVPPNFVSIVPSRKFDGTNALLRMPHDIMATSYDKNSYRNHMKLAKNATRNVTMLHIKHIMADIDNIRDVKYCLGLDCKPALRSRIAGLAGLQP